MFINDKAHILRKLNCRITFTSAFIFHHFWKNIKPLTDVFKCTDLIKRNISGPLCDNKWDARHKTYYSRTELTDET